MDFYGDFNLINSGHKKNILEANNLPKIWTEIAQNNAFNQWKT